MNPADYFYRKQARITAQTLITMDQRSPQIQHQYPDEDMTGERFNETYDFDNIQVEDIETIMKGC